MDTNDHPLLDYAMAEFMSEFGNLLTNGVRIELYEYEIINRSMSDLLLMAPDDQKIINWRQIVHSAYSILQNGLEKNAREVYESFLHVTSDIVLGTNTAKAKLRIANESNGDNQFYALLDLYKTLYEGVMPMVAAPVVVAFRCHTNGTEKAFFTKEDGTINIRALKMMEKWNSTHLHEGLNSHVRNAFCHEYYEIQDGQQIKLWDMNPKDDRVSWGPETWTLEQLGLFCRRLRATTLSLSIALCIMSINYRHLITESGWQTTLAKTRTLREKHIRGLVRYLAEMHSLSVRKLEINRKTLTLTLQTQPRGNDELLGIPNEDHIVHSGYNKSIYYEQVFLKKETGAFLNRVTEHLPEMDEFHVEVNDEQGNYIANFFGSRTGVAPALQKAKTFINNAAASQPLDSALMWVKRERVFSKTLNIKLIDAISIAMNRRTK